MKNIVTVGGGTGSFTILSGLKNLENISLTALVSMADDGGSNGVLRDELGVLPPSDVRLCIVALSEHTEIVRKLMNYRFSEGGLSGHTFGNIFLAALEKVTGDFAQGVEIVSGILKVKGLVIPITKNKAELSVLLSGGKLIEGETKIDHANLQNTDIEKIFYKNNVQLNENAKRAIEEADYIILGPGDYYTSIIPNLIVTGFKEAIAQSGAKIILPINLTNKQGHTMHWKTSNYVKIIESYLEKSVDLILVNNEAPSGEQIERYKLEEGDGVLVEDDSKDGRVIRESLLSHAFFVPTQGDKLGNTRSFIRHDSQKLARCIAKIINQ
jgi:uncharacterized cofD-like protein